MNSHQIHECYEDKIKILIFWNTLTVGFLSLSLSLSIYIYIIYIHTHTNERLQLHKQIRSVQHLVRSENMKQIYTVNYSINEFIGSCLTFY